MDNLQADEFLYDLTYNACNIQPHIFPSEDDQQSALTIVWYTNVLCLPTIALVGLTCNLLNLLILTGNKSARRIPSWHLLIALAVFDSLFLIFATIEVTPMSIHKLMTWHLFNIIYTHIALYIRTLASTFYKASVLIVVSFNIERYVCVCHPLSAHRICTSKRSKQAIFISLFISFICSIQWPIVYNTIECYDANKLYKYYIITISGNKLLQKYYKILDYFSLFTFNVAPIVILFFLNYKLIATLRKVVNDDITRNNNNDSLNDKIYSNNNNNVFNESTSSKLNANAMLFSVVGLLFICVGPQAPARLLYEYYGHYHTTAVIYTCISQQMVFLNAALNFCLYCLVSRRYRGLLKESFKKIFKKNNDFYSSTGIQLKTKFSTLQSPSTTANEELHPILERRASAF